MKAIRVVCCALVFSSLLAVPYAWSTSPPASGASRFFVTESHTKEECLKALDDAKAVGTGFLNKCDWGCMAGDHTAYLILEGKDEAAVRKSLPAAWSNANIVKLNKFTAEQIASFHKK